MTRGELERAHRHYVAWAELVKLRERIVEQGMIVTPGDKEPSATRFLPPDHSLTRAVLAELQHNIANEAQILTFLGVDMRDDQPASAS